MKETKDQLKLTEKEEQKAQKMSAFMQRYQEFKKDKEKRETEEKTSKKQVFKVTAIKHLDYAVPLKSNSGENIAGGKGSHIPVTGASRRQQQQSQTRS